MDIVSIALHRDLDDLHPMTFELVRWRLRWMVPTLVLLAVTAVAGLLAAAQADARAKGAAPR